MKNKGNNYLKENGIHGGKYFYPLISDFPSYRGLDSANSTNLPNVKNWQKR